MNINGAAKADANNQPINTSFIVRLPLAPQASACVRNYNPALAPGYDGWSPKGVYCLNYPSLTSPSDSVPPDVPPNGSVVNFSKWSECTGTRWIGEPCGPFGRTNSYDVYKEWSLNEHANKACPLRLPPCSIPLPVCGNGIVDWDEACDGSNFDGKTCQSLGYDGGGSLLCESAYRCTQINTSGCKKTSSGTVSPASFCGNGLIETGEICDGANLKGLTCQSFGYNSGTLFCDSQCFLDTSRCSTVSTGGTFLPTVGTGSTILPRLPGAPATRGSLIVP